MKITNITQCLLLLTVLSFTSCATYFKKEQNITIHSQYEKSDFFVDGEKIGSGKSIDYTTKHDFEYQLKTEGYEDLHGFIYALRLSPLVHLSIFIAGWQMEENPYRFSENYNLPHQRELTYRKENQHYFNVGNVAFKVESENYDISTQQLNQYLKNKPARSFKNKRLSNKNSDYSINLEQSIFDDALNVFCQELDFIDTTGAFLSSRFNSLKLEATVDDIDFLVVKVNKVSSFFETTVQTKWKIINGVGEEIFSKKTKNTSGKFSTTGNGKQIENSINTSVVDAFRDAILDLVESEDFQKVLETPLELKKPEPISILKPVSTASKLNEAVKACVTIKVDEGHGSGFFINNEGYILTNYHVVKDGKNIEVIYNSETFKTEVIQLAKFADLALLKVDIKPEYAIAVTDKRMGSLGKEVYAIGTPNSVELPATISKGIVSGYRKSGKDYELVQTDVSINFGNSGGPIINSNTKLVGIVNSKMAGFGIEGISFGLSNEYIMSELNLTYQ